MSGWFLLLPFIAACIGWWLVAIALRLIFHPEQPRKIAGITYQGLFPKRQNEWAKKAGALSASFLSIKEIEEKITHPDNVKKIMPQAEEHIDHFLRVKLVKSMPVVGMFVGDKTINNLKSLFITELEELFPEIMKSYIGHLQEEVDIEKIVTQKIAAFPPACMEKIFFDLLKKEVKTIKWMGALLGFSIGLIQLLIAFIIAK